MKKIFNHRVLLVCACALFGANGAETAGPGYRSFFLPVSVSGLPDAAEFVPVFTSVNFSKQLERLGVKGAVDERSIRLYRVTEGGEAEVPVQFTSEVQPRPSRRATLPGTAPNISYLAEYAAGENPEVVRVAGTLAWIAAPDESGSAKYILRFGVPLEGRAIQVPFLPQNLRAFDAEGRAHPVPWFPVMQLHPQWPFEGVGHAQELQQLITSYHLGPSVEEAQGSPKIRRPFFYPVNGPDGIPLTEFGKPHDPTGSHAHHYSLWIAHHDVNGVSFWGERAGIIAHERFEKQEDGPIYCRLVQKNRWIHESTELLHETRTITIYKQMDDFRLIDLELVFAPSSANAVTFGKTSFGFLAARVAQSMTVFDGGGEIRNSNGDLNEQNAHYKRARWIDQSGPVAPERWGGIALLDHPSNPNHPTGWHCRNDGWAGASFNLHEPYTLEAGATLKLKYRVHLHKQDAVRGKVGQRYEEFAAEPMIAVGALKESSAPR